MSQFSARLRTAAGQPVSTGQAILQQVREDDVPFMAGSIAYQAFVSIVPLLVLLFLVVATVGDEATASAVVRLSEGFLPEAAQSLVREAIVGTGGIGSAGVSIIGVVTLVWGSLKIFRGLDKAFSEIFETEAENSLLDQFKDATIVLAVLAVAITAMVLAGSVFAVFEGILARVVNLLALVVGLTVAFLPIYRFFPDDDLSWADAVPGAILAAVGWTVLQFLFQVYVSVSGQGDPSSALGAILLLLLWLYLAGLVLLLGGVVNAVLLGDEPSQKIRDAADGAGAELREYERLLHEERDRRQRLERERDRLERELEASSSADADGAGADLRAENRALRHQLRWERKSLPARVALRLLGADPTRRPETGS